MSIDQIKQISVIGSGAMGAQIALVCALAGYKVTLQDINEESLQKAEESLHGHMQRSIDKGRLTQEQVQEAFANLQFHSSLEEAVQDSDFVIEAIVEKLDIKRDLFAKLDQFTKPHAILTTNSSTIVSSKVADATNRADKVCNMHFFNPPLIMKAVEVVKGPHTSDETAKVTYDLVEKIGKTPILIEKEITGFVANRILAKLMDEAIYLYEEGIASYEDIDLACTTALNHPIGPFALIDLTGLDVHYNVRMERYKAGEGNKPSKTVSEKVEKGELGRKTGQGFYTYKK